MKKRRYIFWRYVLALLLGAGAWWLVKWCITPKVHFEATYQTQEFTKPAKAVLNALGMELDTSYVLWDAYIWDQQGRYLLAGARWKGRFPKCYDLIDLQTGKTLVKQRLTTTEMEFDDRWHSIRTAHPYGDIFGYKYQSSYAPDDETRDRLTKEILNGSISFRLDRERQKQHGYEIVFRSELWSWNPLSNHEKPIHRFGVNSQLRICHDCTAVLEIERVTPMLPSFLMPLSLPNVLTAQVTAEMGLGDMAVMRVWNLPEMSLRCTITVPWMYRQGQAEITADGSYVVLHDVNLPREFTSKHHYQYEFSHHQYRSILDAYASSPTGLRAYDTRTGNLWWEKSDYAGVYAEYDEIGQNFVHFLKPRDSLLEQPCLLLHLPSRQLLETSHCYSAALLSPNQIQYVSLHEGKKLRFEIHMNDGVKGSQLDSAMREPRCIPGAPQVVVEQYGMNSDSFPAWVQSTIRSMKWLSDLLEGIRHRLEVLDYSVNRALISIPVDTEHQRTDVQVTDRWLLIQKSDNDGLKVSVYSIPLPSWSPMWPWAAGFAIFLLSLYSLRRRQLQRG